MTRRAFDAVHWYLAEIGSQVIVKTGIPSDRYHIGKLLIHSFQEDPDFVSQIDGGTGESETNGSILDRSIRCAISLRNLGLKKGDVMVLMGPNHLDFCIPHYAALYLGILIASIDATLGPNELRDLFHTNQPNIIFCQGEKTPDVKKALDMAKVDSKVVTFDQDSKYSTLADLLENDDEKAIQSFKPTDLDPADAVAYLTSTSGTTGTPKTAMLTHKNLTIGVPYLWSFVSKFPTPTKMVIVTSPAQWLSAGFHYLFSPVMKYQRLQTSSPLTPDHFADLVNKYKPTFIATSPTMMTTMMARAKCDFTCFESVLLGGSAVSQENIDEVKDLGNGDFHESYRLGVFRLKESIYQGPRPLFHTNQPNIIFCQSEKTPDVKKALDMAKVDSKVVTFDQDSKYSTLADLLENDDEKAIQSFKPTDLDPADAVAYLTSTSGTTGTPKTAMLTHKNLTIGVPYLWSFVSKFPTPTKMVIVTSPAQWLSAGFHYLFSPVMKYQRLQTSSPLTPDHFADLVNKYKPTFIATSPTMMTTMMARAKCDFTCFESVLLGGSAVSQENIDEVKGYHNNPEATKEAMTEDGWLKSGDIFYRDSSWNLFFVERYKLLLKYRNHQVSPVEIETVIMRHPGVFHVAVTGVPDKEHGDLVAACVVPKPGYKLTAQEIKDLVKDSLTDSKQLRGGVVFMKELPQTSTSKVNRKVLKELVLTLPRE